MAGHQLHWDEEAERAVVGTCLNTRHGIGYLDLVPSDFYRPNHAALYAACEAMCDVVGLAERIAYAVAFTDVDEADVRALVREAPVQFNSGPWAARVAECAKRRAAMHRCVEAYEALRDGAEIDEVMAWTS